MNGCLLFVNQLLVHARVSSTPFPSAYTAATSRLRRLQDDRPRRALDVLERRSPDEIRRDGVDLVLNKHPAGILRVRDQSVDRSCAYSSQEFEAGYSIGSIDVETDECKTGV